MSDYVLIWRPTEGPAVSTFSTDDKRPRVWTDEDEDVPDAKDAPPVNADELSRLLASREAFEAKRVSVNLAEQLLGWSVTDDSSHSEIS